MSREKLCGFRECPAASSYISALRINIVGLSHVTLLLYAVCAENISHNALARRTP